MGQGRHSLSFLSSSSFKLARRGRSTSDSEGILQGMYGACLGHEVKNPEAGTPHRAPLCVPVEAARPVDATLVSLGTAGYSRLVGHNHGLTRYPA
jgi:hypothetical protein